MEKTEKISIGHYTFSLDGNAYSAVRDYLDKLKSHYDRQSDGNEIMDSIEARIAELLYERCGQDGVVTASDVRYVIDIMGFPENFDSGKSDNATASVKSDGTAKEENGRRRLYRDKDDRKVGGVCGGLARAVNVDPLWLRLGFIAVLILTIIIDSSNHHTDWWVTAPLLYLILMICLPQASSVRQRWEMRGENGTVNDITTRKQESRRNGRGCLAVGFGIILILIGLFFLAVKISVLGGVLFTSNLTFGMLRWIPGMDFIGSILGMTPFTNIIFNPWIQVMSTLIAIIPSILAIYGGILLVFDIRPPKWRPGLWLALLWLLLQISLIPITFISFRKVPDNLNINITNDFGNSIKEVQQWLEEHNFDNGDWDELNDWLEEHNFDSEETRDVKEWMEKHNFVTPDTLYCPEEFECCPDDSAEITEIQI